MIGLLRGRILIKQPPQLLLEVNGVGYEVQAPMSTFYALPADDEPVTLYTHLMVRDDAHTLFGFFQQTDRELFRTLLKVNGVGGKMALAILSGMNSDEFAMTIHAGDVVGLTRLPGVGKKTAERLIMEMRDKLDKNEIAGSTRPAGGGFTAPASPDSDAVSALIALGYRPNDAGKMVRAVLQDGMDTEQVIKAALQGTVEK